MPIRHVVTMFFALVSAATVATAQPSRCADCHFANLPSVPDPNHLFDWDTSAHGRNDVGCDRCHGGEPATFESFLAHRGILTSGNPASPVHPTNLPRTCGGCHVGPFVAFQDSRHYEILREGVTQAPTCATCHGSVAARLLSPRGLEEQCASCHGADGVHPNSDFPPQGRIVLERIGEVRDLLEGAPGLIRRIEDDARRLELEESLRQVEVPLTEAVQSAHRFAFDRTEERLAQARERAEALLRELANP